MLTKGGRGQLHLHKSAFGLLEYSEPEYGLT